MQAMSAEQIPPPADVAASVGTNFFSLTSLHCIRKILSSYNLYDRGKQARRRAAERALGYFL